MRTVTKGATDSRVRTLAHRNWVSQRSLKDLIDAVRDWEVEQSNENDFQRSQRVATIAAVAQGPNDRFKPPNEFKMRNAVQWHSDSRRTGWHNEERRSNFRSGSRGRGGFRQVNPNSQSNSRCCRCGSIYHMEAECRMKHKVCNSCGKLGHISRVCRDPSMFNKQTRAQKRNWSNTVNNATASTAKIHKLDEALNPEEQVMQTSNDTT